MDMDDGCSCHISPPCGWCTSLTEGEASAYYSGGREALDAYRLTPAYEKEKEDEANGQQ